LRKLLTIVVLAAVCVIIACTDKDNSPNTMGFINLDELEKYKIITSNSLVYSVEDIQELAKNESLKNYEVVIKQYMTEKLGQTVSYIDTVDGTYNPRKVVVGTEEGLTYLLELRKWYNYNDIWTVSSHSQFNVNNEALPPELIPYEEIEPDMVTDSEIQGQINQYIAAREEGQYYFNVNDTFYVLLVAGANQSVELLHLYGNPSLLNVEYAYVDNRNVQYGEAPYALLRVDDVEVVDLFFKEYSTIKVRDERLNME